MDDDPLQAKPKNSDVEKEFEEEDGETQSTELPQVTEIKDKNKEKLLNYPLCSKDSQWEDILLHKSTVDKKDEEHKSDEELEINSIHPTDETEFPLYLLFPTLRNVYPNPKDVLTNQISTTDITKTIIGQKPDFSVMKISKQLLPTKVTLPSIDESPLETSTSTDRDEKRWEKLFQEDSHSLTNSARKVAKVQSSFNMGKSSSFLNEISLSKRSLTEDSTDHGENKPDQKYINNSPGSSDESIKNAKKTP